MFFAEKIGSGDKRSELMAFSGTIQTPEVDSSLKLGDFSENWFSALFSI